MTSARKGWERWTPLFLAAAAGALYAPSLFNGLTNFDDGEYLEHNPIAAQGLAGLGDAFTRTFDGAWYPLTQAGYALLHAVAGPSPLAHHLACWLLFALAAALLPRALEAFSVPRAVSLAAGLLWLAHPFRAESVAWAANLKDPLSLALVLASFALLASDRRWASAAAFAAALLAKSMVFPLALLVPLALWQRGERPRQALAWSWPHLAGAAAIASAALVVHLSAQAGHVPSADAAPALRPGDGTLLGALPSMLWLPWWYLGRTLWPLHPQAIYAPVSIGWTDLRFFEALAGYAVLAAAFVLARMRRGALLLAVAAWLLPLAAVTGAVPMTFHRADRYTLFPSLALAVALAWAGQRRLQARPAIAGVSLAALLVPLSAGAVSRQHEWKDGIALFEANRRDDPAVAAARYDLAGAYGGAGRWTEAIAELEEVRRLLPASRRVDADLLFALAARDGLPVTAIQLYQAALEQERWSPEAQLRLATRLLAEKRSALVRFLASTALRDAESGEAHALLGKAAALEKQWDEAAAQAQRALELDPADDTSRADLVIALAELGQGERALQLSEKPGRDPKSRALLWGARGYALFKLGRAAEARELLDRARRELGTREF